MEFSTLFQNPYALEIFKLLNGLLVVAIIFIPIERLFYIRKQHIFRKGFIQDVGFYFVTWITVTFILVVPIAMTIRFLGYFPLEPLHLWVGALPLWIKVVMVLIVGDGAYYWVHRLMHTIPFLWHFHAIHHAAEEMDWLVNVRIHPVEIVLTRTGQFAPAFALGLIGPHSPNSTGLVLIIPLVSAIWGYFIHANIRFRFGFIEALLASPAFHHWHHNNDGKEFINKNYAALFPFLDRLFGSLYLPKRNPKIYGVPEQVPKDLAGRMIYPFQKIWEKYILRR